MKNMFSWLCHIWYLALHFCGDIERLGRLIGDLLGVKYESQISTLLVMAAVGPVWGGGGWM